MSDTTNRPDPAGEAAIAEAREVATMLVSGRLAGDSEAMRLVLEAVLGPPSPETAPGALVMACMAEIVQAVLQGLAARIAAEDGGAVPDAAGPAARAAALVLWQGFTANVADAEAR